MATPSKPLAAFLQFMAARHEILACHLSIGIEAGKFGELSRECSSALARQLVFASLTDEFSLAEIMRGVVAGPMLAEDKARVVEAANTKLATPETSTPCATSGKHQLQANSYLYNYLTAEDWTTLSGCGNMNDRATYLATRVLAIGLFFPNEKTTACAVAILVLSSNRDFSCTSSLLNLVREYKMILKSKASRTTKPAMQLPLEYTPDPSKLQASHPTLYLAAYPRAPPIASTISPSEWCDMILQAARVNLGGTCGTIGWCASRSASLFF